MLSRRSIFSLVAVTMSGTVLGSARPRAAEPLKIGVIGAGSVGSTVGGLWVKSGHRVMFASRHPDELRSLATSLGAAASVGTPQQALAFGDVVFLAVPYGALPELGKSLGAAWQGKIVLDATNPYAWRDGAAGREALAKGAGVTTASFLPGARIVRAFNSMTISEVGDAAHRSGAPLAIPIAGDDHQAVAVAEQLVRDAGCAPLLVGGLAAAKLFQPGGPGFQVAGTVPELRSKLGLPAAP